MEKEREEGYFDAEGNFVEFVNENEIKVSILELGFVEFMYIMFYKALDVVHSTKMWISPASGKFAGNLYISLY